MGIDAEIVNVEWAQWLEQVFKNHDFDLTIVSHTEPMDIGIYARPDYYFGYDDPVMRALIAGVEATADPAEQAEILRAAQERVASHFVNAFLFQLPKTGVADARLRGLWANSPTQANDMTGGLLGGIGRPGAPLRPQAARLARPQPRGREPR